MYEIGVSEKQLDLMLYWAESNGLADNYYFDGCEERLIEQFIEHFVNYVFLLKLFAHEEK